MNRSSSSPSHASPDFRFYGRRRGRRLRPGQAALYSQLLPRFILELPPSSATYADLPRNPNLTIDPSILFPFPPQEIWLEIGFGAGEHLARRAAQNPHIGFIGCEIFLNGIVSLLGAMNQEALQNIRIFPDDARRLFPFLAAASVGRAFLLFPDPWPKARHHERRFINTANLNALARILRPAAQLHFASDDPVLLPYGTAMFAGHPAFQGGEIGDRPADWPPTRYEQKALKAGRAPRYFVYHRTPAAPF